MDQVLKLLEARCMNCWYLTFIGKHVNRQYMLPE